MSQNVCPPKYICLELKEMFPENMKIYDIISLCVSYLDLNQNCHRCGFLCFGLEPYEIQDEKGKVENILLHQKCYEMVAISHWIKEVSKAQMERRNEATNVNLASPWMQQQYLHLTQIFFEQTNDTLTELYSEGRSYYQFLHKLLQGMEQNDLQKHWNSFLVPRLIQKNLDPKAYTFELPFHGFHYLPKDKTVASVINQDQSYRSLPLLFRRTFQALLDFDLFEDLCKMFEK